MVTRPPPRAFWIVNLVPYVLSLLALFFMRLADRGIHVPGATQLAGWFAKIVPYGPAWDWIPFSVAVVSGTIAWIGFIFVKGKPMEVQSGLPPPPDDEPGSIPPPPPDWG